ncbi:MAG: DUF4249 domain-containing protein [Muribaculaceae bacterium]|nr:DUF4249 domain-containing protein [Muribaculaceae bacterium]
MKGLQITAYISAALFLSLISCEKELDFKYHDINPILVIEGSLTDNGVVVTITDTTPMAEPMDKTLLTDASVSITDLTSSVVTTLLPDSNGSFTADIAGEAGHSYRLDVEHGGKHFSAISTMTLPVEITDMEFNWVKMPYDDVAGLRVSFTDSGSVNDRYWVRVYRNGNAYQWNIVSDLLATDGIIDQIIFTSRRDTEEEDEKSILEEGDVVTTSVTPISRAMYDYLEAITIGGSNGPQMFEGDFCLGYFLAAPVTSRSIVFDPANIPYYN